MYIADEKRYDTMVYNRFHVSMLRSCPATVSTIIGVVHENVCQRNVVAKKSFRQKFRSNVCLWCLKGVRVF